MLSAQQLKVSGPKIAYVEEGFRIDYSISSSEKLSHFEQPQISGAEIISGPYTSKNSSNINGRESYSATYTIVLKATQTGKVTLSPAKIKVGSRIISSQGLNIEVHSGDNRLYGTPNYQQKNNSYQTDNYTTKQTSVNNNSLFIRAVANKSSLVKGEAMLVSYKLYIPLSSDIQTEEYSINKMPNFSGFEMAELNIKDKSSYVVENYNGRRYKVATLKEILLYPYITGTLTLPSINVNILFGIPGKTEDSFSTGDAFIDSFFQNSFLSTRYEHVRKDLSSNTLQIEVKDLPQPKPENFMEGVGDFSLTSVISSNEVRALDAFYLIYTIEGGGNLTQITSLPINLGDNFQVSDPEILDNITETSQGIKGNRTFRYLVIPLDTGNFIIPELSMSYYDLKNKQYKYLESEHYNISVSKAEVSTEYAKQLERRAKYKNMSVLPTKTFAKKRYAKHIFDNKGFYFTLLLIILITVIAYYSYSKYLKNISDIERNKKKKASNRADKSLRKAKELLSNEDYDEFEKEITSVLWSYLSDKFQIEKTEFTTENIAEQLIKEGISEENTNRLVEIFNRCLYMRYSQNKQYDTYNAIYNDTESVITDMEQGTKQSKQHSDKDKQTEDGIVINLGKKGLQIFVLFVLLFAWPGVFANNKKTETILTEEDLCLRAEVYFKNKDYANSILYYEKALKLSPNNKDIKLNINIVRARLMGDCYVMSDILFVRVFKYISGTISLVGWAILTIILLSFTGIAFCFYGFSHKKVLWFYLSLFAFIFFILAFCLGITRQQIQNNTDYAIIMNADTKVKTFKHNDSKDVLTLYKGQKIKIINEEKLWLKVSTEDKREGYINNKGYKRI